MRPNTNIGLVRHILLLSVATASLLAQGRQSSVSAGAINILMRRAALLGGAQKLTVDLPQLITQAAGSELESSLIVGSEIEALALTGAAISADSIRKPGEASDEIKTLAGGGIPPSGRAGQWKAHFHIDGGAGTYTPIFKAVTTEGYVGVQARTIRAKAWPA